MTRVYAAILVGLLVCRPGLTADPPAEVPAARERFDYFVNNWNVVGLKDYRNGSRITPSNELLLAGKTPIQVRLGPNRTPLSRANPKVATDGWMPIILVTAEDGPVRYEVTYWATPLPDVKDWRKAFDWPTEGENFLCWIRVKATNTSDGPIGANVEVAPDRRINLPRFRHPEPQAEPKIDRPHTRKHSWSWRLGAGASAEGVARYTFFPADGPGSYDQEDAQAWLKRTIDYWRGDGEGDYTDVPGFCFAARTEEVSEHGYVLTPGRYVGAEEIEDDGEPFEEKMPRLVGALSDQFAESARLEKTIRSNLEALGLTE